MTALLFACVKPKKILISLALLSVAICAPLARAGSAKWSTTSIQYLSGEGYALGTDSRGLITLEHANAWEYGDNFFFVDITNVDRSETGLYGEISPRVSIDRLRGITPSTEGWVKEYLLTFTGEFSGTGGRALLYGAAVDLNIPGFAFFKVNFYRRDEVSKDDIGMQITLSWKLPFEVMNTPWVFEGFYDYAFGLDNANNIVTAPRVLVDAGAIWDKPGVLEIGMEYHVWRNKFGIAGVDENVPQLMLKWIW